MNKYSLKQLAHLSRCLFPGDFRDELVEMGVEDEVAYYLSSMLHTSQGSRNILDLYQVCIYCEEDINIIDAYCQWWINMYN